MRQVLKSGRFEVTVDQEFRAVMENCRQSPRPGQEGTWIHPEMIDAYVHLHELGIAHSVECWDDSELVGGLYGINLGSCFMGESMFSKVSNASKTAFIYLVQNYDFRFIDCQVYTTHLESLGAEEISRMSFQELLNTALLEFAPMGVGYQHDKLS
jgi:leucyl/phenylalanyl-tRNA--protein transferase